MNDLLSVDSFKKEHDMGPGLVEISPSTDTVLKKDEGLVSNGAEKQ
jgi:hypothetical protein